MNPIIRYFSSLKIHSVILLSFYLLSFILSVYWLTLLKQPLYNGIAYVFFAFSIIQMSIRIILFLRSKVYTQRLTIYYSCNITKIKVKEIPRMKKVLRNFIVYFSLEFILLLLGLFFVFWNGSHALHFGLGIGLLIQTIILLIADYTLYVRGQSYFEFLQHLFAVKK